MAVVKGASVVTTSTSTKSTASTRTASGREAPVERAKSAPASGKSRASATAVQGMRSSTPLDNGST